MKGRATMSQRRVDNSTFRKNKRYITGMHTLQPELAPQYYTHEEKTPTGTLGSSHFTFDGQIFSRDKKNGGNVPSSWCISGKSLSKKELADKKHQEGFHAFMGGLFGFIQSDAVSTPILIGADDIKRMSIRIKNDFK